MDSCQQIFDGPMCHITSGKVKTSMLLIWARPDGEDIYKNFNLPPHLRHDVDHVFKLFNLRNFVSQFVTLEWQDLSFPRFTSTIGSKLMCSTTEY